MKVQHHSPEAKLLVYQADENSSHYRLLTQPLGFNKMPDVIKIESIQQKGIIDANKAIRGRHGTWDRSILTGLKPAEQGYKEWFYGDHYLYGEKSYLLIRISINLQTIEIFYFNGFYPQTKSKRKLLNSQFILRYQKQRSE